MVKRAAVFLRHIGCADRQLATLGHRVARIDREIHNDLIKLVLIDLHKTEIAPVNDFEFNSFSEQARQQILQFSQRIGER